MTQAQETYNWIMGIIDSCNNDFHFDGADRLIELFKERYPGEDGLHTELVLLRQGHWNTIHAILV